MTPPLLSLASAFSIVYSISWWLIASQVLSAVVGFVLGLIVGWKLADGVDLVTKARVRKLIALLVTAIWSVSIIADIFVPSYSTSVLLYAIMGAVSGYFFSEDGFTINIGE